MTLKTHYRPWMQSSNVNIIFTALDGNARFVGGAVRDAVIGIDAKDIDITTPYHPDEVTKKLESAGIKVIPTGIKHGTVTAVSGGINFEITTLRRDVDCTGRHAEVEFTDDWQEDAARRDFTINAMSCNQNGEIFDYFNGLDDLKSGHLRFVGEAAQRCREDYLRILRFFRFFAYYGKSPANKEAIEACASEAKGIEGLSGERIASEMFKLLATPSPIFSLKLMLENNITKFVIPGITTDNINALNNILPLSKEPIVRLAALVGKNLNSANFIAKRWKLSNDDKARLLFLCNPEYRFDDIYDEKKAKKCLRAWEARNFIDICHISLAWEMDREVYNKLIELSDWQIPVFPLGGSALKNLGLIQGKELGEMLKLAESFWEENDYKPGAEELLEFIKGNL